MSEADQDDLHAEKRHAPSAQPTADKNKHAISLRSNIGLNAVNFFLGQSTGVVLPFLGAYFKEKEWSEIAIGIGISLAGLGFLLMQTPAGVIVDRVRQRQWTLACACIVVGACYGLLPLVPAHPAVVDPILFLAGTGQAFYLPILGALALGLVGQAALNRMMGQNQSWTHAGNFTVALIAMGLVQLFGVTSVFFAVPVISLLAAGSGFLIGNDKADGKRASGGEGGAKKEAGLRDLLKDRRVLILLATTALFNLATAPVLPFIGAYITEAGGTQFQVAALVLVSQAVMIPVALITGELCDRFGRKRIFSLAFVMLPVRIFLYSFTRDPWWFVALQAFDGIGAGIYGVVMAPICADLTRDKGGFNSLSGMAATALGLGGVAGPLGAGFFVSYVGYNGFFYTFAGVAAVAAVLFVALMPETGDHRELERQDKQERHK